jgi:glycosyltransferase involved in cell wall biosynthesis
VPIELGIIKNWFLILTTKLFEKMTYRFADRIICISEAIKERIPIPDKKKFYVPTGCDLGLFNTNKNDRWKQETGIAGRSLFVFTGAIGIANNPEYLMDAAKILKEKKSEDISIALVGNGSAKKDVLKMIAEYHLDNVWIFDPVPKWRLPEILASADGGIILHGLSPTCRETASPNKFYDYIAAGLPLIFNFQGPLKDLILEKRAGYYVDYRSPEQLSEALMHISSNKSEALEFGRNARLLAEKFDQKKTVVQFENILVDCYRHLRTQ